MDIYGIGSALKSFLQGHSIGARRSGKTTQMFSRIKEGDFIVCLTGRARSRYMSMLREKGFERVDVLVIPAMRLGEILERRGPEKGAVHFDDCFVQAYFELRVDFAINDLADIQKRFSQEVCSEPKYRMLDLGTAWLK